MNQIMRGEPLSIFGDGEQTRAFSYVGDIVDPIVDAPDVPEARNEIFNVGADQPYSINQLAEIIRNAMGVPDHPVVHHQARNEVVDAYSDHSKVRRVFGDHPTVSLEDGVQRMVEWAKAHGSHETTPFPAIEVEKNLPPSWRH
jgi:UDP-glucose 4-epimerase